MKVRTDMAAKKKKTVTNGITMELVINFQKMFRRLDFGRSLKGKAPSLTVTQMRVLTFFNENDVVYISEVSRSLRMSIQSVNNLISRLEVLGYVERSKNAEDKRLSDIRLTEQGRRGFDAFRNEQIEILAGIVNQLAPAEQKMLAATVANAALILEKAAMKAAEGEK
jgi:DNA-binding MarR family transcriptional regulator